VLTVFPVLGFAGAAMLWNQLAGGEGPGPVFVFVWLAIFAFMAYSFLVRIAYEVGVVDGSILRWRSITARHEVPLLFVRAIGTWGTSGKKITVDGHLSPLLMVAVGFDDVLAMIVQFRPDLVIQTAWYDGLVKRFSLRSMYWRRL
jgi:hypothetical protein